MNARAKLRRLAGRAAAIPLVTLLVAGAMALSVGSASASDGYYGTLSHSGDNAYWYYEYNGHSFNGKSKCEPIEKATRSHFAYNEEQQIEADYHRCQDSH